MTAASFWPCRWDWCRASFSSSDELIAHVIHHTSAAPPLTRADLKRVERLEADHPFSTSEGSCTYAISRTSTESRTTVSWLASTPRPSQAQSSSQAHAFDSSQPVAAAVPLKTEPASPASHEWANSRISLLSPRASSSRQHTPAVAGRMNEPKPAPSFAALSASNGVQLTPPLQRLPPSPTSEEQVYRLLGNNALASVDVVESDGSSNADSVARQLKRKRTAATTTPATPRARAGSRRTTPVPSQRRPGAISTPASAKRSQDALPYPSFSDAELDASDAEQTPTGAGIALPDVDTQFTMDDGTQSQESMLLGLQNRQLEPLALATQMPLSQDTLDWEM